MPTLSRKQTLEDPGMTLFFPLPKTRPLQAEAKTPNIRSGLMTFRKWSPEEETDQLTILEAQLTFHNNQARIATSGPVLATSVDRTLI